MLHYSLPYTDRNVNAKIAVEIPSVGCRRTRPIQQHVV